MAIFKSQLGYCMLCGGPSIRFWCKACHEDMLYKGPRCLCCAIPLPQPGRCGRCSATTPNYTLCRPLYLYHYPCKSIIKRYKYSGYTAYASSFACYFTEYIINNNDSLPESILSVPLHWKKQALRGFNQSFAFARKLAKGLGIPFVETAIQRTRNTRSQTGLNEKERRKNVSNAFSLTADLHYKHVALVDDVTSTGATANEIARLLKKESIELIELWVIARSFLS